MPGLRSITNIRRGIAHTVVGGTELNYETYPGLLFNTPAGRQGGVWYDPSDMSTLFQDIERTQPVTESGQRVAVMLDKSGNNHHMYQDNANYRPEFVIEGTRKFLRFSRTRQDFLATESGRVASLTLTNFHAFALYHQQTTIINESARFISAGQASGTSGFAICTYHNDGIWGSIRTNGTRFDYTGNTGTPAPRGVYEFKYNGSTMGVTYQGETESTTDYSTALGATNSRIAIGRSTSSDNSLSSSNMLFDGDWYGYFHVNRVLTTAEINECRTWARKQITSIGLPAIVQRTLPSTHSSVVNMTYSNGALKFSRSGNTIAHSSTGLHAWRIEENGTATKVSFSGNDTTNARRALAISPDGDMILTGRTTTNTLIQVNKWNGSSYSMVGEIDLLNGYTGLYVADMDFSPDGQYLVVLTGAPSSTSTRTGVWKRNGDTFDTPVFYNSSWTTSTGPTKGVKWMHNGTHYAVMSGSASVGRIFSFNGTTVSSVQSYTTTSIGLYIRFSSDDRYMVATSGNLSGVPRAFLVRESNKNIVSLFNSGISSATPMMFKRDGSWYALVPRYNSWEMNLWKFNGYSDTTANNYNLAYQVGANEKSWLLEDLGLSDLVPGANHYYFSDFVYMSDRTRIAFTTTSIPYLRVWDIPYDSVP